MSSIDRASSRGVLRFRLSESGPVPDGIGEERGVPLFVRLTREFVREFALHLWAGAVVAGDASSRFIRASSWADPAPHFEITLTACVNGTSTAWTRSFAMM